ncbi:MAG: phosphoribosylformylglycinamidine synthase I [Spirochaetaceae bacterium]|nr:phosphoribosylformylglycinamidine synthase I [Spirochaetaceae bacterium]
MKALVLKAPGTNRDRDLVEALELAGSQAEVVPLAILREAPERIQKYGMVVVPGGFSYGDALGAGKLLALDLITYFQEAMSDFVASGRPVLGICNGFQALVKAGLLPGSARSLQVTLTANEKGRFECRWVRLAAPASHCIWTQGLEDFWCPVAHGEGRLASFENEALARLREGGHIALIYTNADGQPAGGEYPANPNGSIGDIAGLCNEQGNVLGLMPHPENAVFSYQTASLPGKSGKGALELLRRGVAFALQS